MEFSLNSIGDFLKSSTGEKLVDSVLGNKAPAAPPSTPSPVIGINNPVSSGMSTKTMMMIGGAVVVAIIGLVFIMKK